MKWNKISFKLGLSIILLLAVVLLSLGFVLDRLFSGFFYTQMREDAEELANHFSKMAESHDSSADQMIKTFAEFSNVNIYMMNGEGKAITKSGYLNIPEETFLSEKELQSVVSGIDVDKPYEEPSGGRYFVSARLVRTGIHQSDIIVVLSSMKAMDESVLRARYLLVLSGIGAFLLAIGFTFIISRVLSRPLIQMEQITRKIAKGELQTRLAIRSSDEVGVLAASINDLAKDLQRYRDTRQEFFANISHELRTPVTYLEGYSKVLADGLYDTEEEMKQYLDIIRHESSRMKHLIHDLFELAKMEEGQLSLTMEWIDPARIIESVVQKVRLEARSKGLGLQVELRHESGRMYADSSRIEQILTNLLENAIRYTENGDIKVSLSKETQYWQVEVRDTGMGIPESELPYIFERFYRIEKSRSRQYGGTGLGLSIVKKLVELQGGTIRVQSELGKGTVFQIHFPFIEHV